MNLLTRIYVTGLAFGLISCFSIGALAGDCDATTVTSGNLQIDQSTTNGGCTLKVHPAIEPKAYRAVEVDQRGVLQIFNQYDVPNPTPLNSTATRTYFIFPRKQAPTFVAPTAGTNSDDPLLPTQIVTASGDPVFFLQGRRSDGGVDDSSLPQITSSDSPNFQLIEDPEVTTDNDGGVDILINENAQVVLLDCGYRKGGSACNLANGSSTIMDRKQLTCSLPNRSLFNYVKSEAQLKWKDDASFFAYLRGACPKLSLPSQAVAQRNKTQPSTRVPAQAIQAKSAPTRSIE
jgi:hypothetical protein